MIERLYIDNFRTLVNCEIKLQAMSLLLGPNGSGKSSVFDAVESIKRFVGGLTVVADMFPATELTRWQTLKEQTFEIDLSGDSGLFRYVLKLEHASDRRQSRVLKEELLLDGRPLFTFNEGAIQLFNDQHNPRLAITCDWSRSGLSAIFPDPDSKRLTEFKQRLASILFLRPLPPLMTTDSQEEAETLDRTGANFASWYRYVLRQDISRQLDLFRELKEVIDGFDSLRIEGPADSTTTLRVLIRAPGAPAATPYKFGELSDGQRQLIVLYTILYALSDTKRVLFLDEPDNFLALQEVEPWLTALMDATGQSISQAVVISHHPEVIDHLAREKGIWLTREAGGPTRVQTGKANDTSPLSPSEVEARGW
jgi:predicted ATPase